MFFSHPPGNFLPYMVIHFKYNYIIGLNTKNYDVSPRNTKKNLYLYYTTISLAGTGWKLLKYTKIQYFASMMAMSTEN